MGTVFGVDIDKLIEDEVIVVTDAKLTIVLLHRI
jgi:hypothetical protein